MKSKDLARFKKLLEERRAEVLELINNSRQEGLGVEQADLPDEVDLASTEADQSMNLRLRDREQVLLKKIDKALEKIELGTYGVCERCEEEIGTKRLEARLVAELCIRCKEEMERVERGYAD